MASAFKDSYGWIADYRGYLSSGKKRSRIRIPIKFLVGNSNESAKAFAEECERYCRYIEINPNDIDAVNHAYSLGAINDDIKNRLIGDVLHVVHDPMSGQLPIVEAALMHPSTIYELESNQREYLRHRKELDLFILWSGLKYISEISLQIVQSYINYLKREGYSYHGIRHRLLYIKNACRVGQSHGYPDPLAGWRLIKQDRQKEIDTWSLNALFDLLRCNNDKLVIAVIYLGGFMGLRSSEIIRLTNSDFQNRTLFVGTNYSKNLQSKRQLPVPDIISKLLIEIQREDIIPLIPRPKTGTFYDPSGFDHWLHPMLGKPPKMLRKAFATWAVNILSPRHLESFLGHSCGSVGTVTARHYLASMNAHELIPAAKQINKVLKDNL